METTPKSLTRAARLGRHLRRNLVAYAALFVALSLTPLPSYAASVAIGTKGIKNGAVTTPKLANGAVKPAKIAANAVGSAKIANGSVQTADLAAGARGFTKIVAKRAQFAVVNGGTSTFTVVCDAGQVAIGGGAYASSGLIIGGGTSGTMIRSHPTVPISFPFPGSGPASTGDAPNGWRTAVINNTGDDGTATHYAMCASK
ncbi:hypothetical protein EFK50_01920 [Nocardioides marmoriginsengisoli]|uniref:Uncharacterized protein n=1 Tax=Nocardioides marmoriginsengisoli TaxID=661483 RepID=A0A3N0CQT9_9ACTN|nr:hypothetical protein [Nocardioides marmoriginsengisoli]RNL65824.1 hypothetical protein EFK50_01920 [Nocardioides marmoriginsengisoli]